MATVQVATAAKVERIDNATISDLDVIATKLVLTTKGGQTLEIDLAPLIGDGEPAILRKGETHIQWQLESEGTIWHDLIALVDLKGPQGNVGPAGNAFAYGVLPVVYYSGTAWPTRASSIPAGYTGRVTYDSSTHQNAAAPTDHKAGDRWQKWGDPS